VAKSTSTGAHASIRGPPKPKVVRTSVKPKVAKSKGEIKPDPTSASSEPSRDSDPLVVDQVANGHESEAVTCSDVGSPEDVHDQSEVVSAHDPAADEHVHSDPGVLPEQRESEHAVEQDVHSDYEPVSQNLPEEEEEGEEKEHELVRSKVHKDSEPELAETHAPGVMGNGDCLKVEHSTSGNDIEDIVNLLEGASLSKPRPQSIVSIPDENSDDY